MVIAPLSPNALAIRYVFQEEKYEHREEVETLKA
jgi:hypothetical protein